ncbi:segregation/condensation protein A [Planctomycetales bacterium]|nr:segregation/condensation protein A [Planctomycetales bacterium]
MFTAKLPQYQGPIDLLLYLVRKSELDILTVPITPIVQQYIAFIDTIKEIDINAAGDFLATASILTEIKVTEAVQSFSATLKTCAGASDEIETPRVGLVKQLLEYKKYCDAAAVLKVRGERWQLQFPRLSDDLTVTPSGERQTPIQEVELWDLVSAFGRILRENAPKNQHEVVYDQTPIAVHMRRIHQVLSDKKAAAFRSFFKYGQHKSTMVGLFLASLELVRHEYANIYQDRNFGEIELAHRQSSKPLDFAALNA